MSMASVAADGAEENDQMRQRAQEHGIRSAGINFARDRNMMMTELNLANLTRNTAETERFIKSQQARAEADARVSAAAAGVAGDSVDAVISDTERTAAEAVAQLDHQSAAEERQLKSQAVDTVVNADINKGVFDSTVDRNKGLVKGGLAFVQGYRLGI
jgi:hypothetical protein